MYILLSTPAMKELTGRRNLLSNHKMKPQGVNDMKEKWKYSGFRSMVK